MLKDSTSDTSKIIKIARISGQSPDHPICLSVPETNYLKTVFMVDIE